MENYELVAQTKEPQIPTVNHEPNIKKIEDVDMQTLKSFRERYNAKVVEFGDLKFKKMECQKLWQHLEKTEKELEQEYLKIQEEEKAFTKTLGEKYGDGTLNMETGDFTRVEKK